MYRCAAQGKHGGQNSNIVPESGEPKAVIEEVWRRT
jgi:hypothetical protein